MTNETKVIDLPLSDIKVDPACQARVTTDATTIAEYAEIMTEEGNVFPPVVVYYDAADYWLSDGFHRHAAAKKAGFGSLKAEVRQGSRRDAILYAVGANATLRRTREDKRHAVGILLADEEWSKWSNRTIAHRCGVDEKLVRTLRSASAAKPQIARKVERNGKAYDMNTDNIGRKDGLEGFLATQADVDEHQTQAWFVAPEPPTTGKVNPEDKGDERKALSDDATRSDEVQLEELMSAWASASEEVQQLFLASIGALLSSQAETGPVSTEPESSWEPELSETAERSEPSQEPRRPEPSATELRENRLFDIWRDLKPNPQKCGRQWVVDGCPSEHYPGENHVITERLVPFRAVARAATEDQRQQFLELSRAA